MSQPLTKTAKAAVPPQRSAPPTGLARFQGHPWLTLLTVAVGVMMVALDGTVVAIANPVIQSDLGASPADIQWVTSGYLLALAVFLITAGKIGDRFGHKSTFLVGAAGFAATSAAIGFAGNIQLVIACRVLQGLFGALLQPAALGLLRGAFPAEKLNMAIGIWAGVIGASTAAGPIVGGLLVEHVSWQSVFFINIPVGIAAVALGLWILRDVRVENAAKSFDVPGIALLSVAMFALVWGIIKAPTWGWSDSSTLLFLGGAVLALVLFAFWQTKAKEPLIPLSLFRSVPLSAGALLMVLMAFAFFGAIFFVTFYLQNVHAMTPVQAGVHLLPMTGMMIVGAPAAGAAIGKVGPRIPIVVGMVLTTVAMYGMSTLTSDSGTGVMSLWFVLMGLGISPVMVGATEVIVGNAPLELSGVAGGLQQAAMQVGGSLGTAVLGAVMAAKVTDVLPGNWAAAGLPPVDPAQQAGLDQAAQLGIAPPAPAGTPEQVVQGMATAVHESFVSGMSLAFAVAAAVAFAAALLGLLTKRGATDAGPAVHI
ncbi:EmrB/QacA subfamily drug resistance transporter [Kitasatospora gansuensis]|uniref:EmrB/QacA subfamily drug resistance transporter n=1 Tax=Kitasatospora gansuensis TaxID=258050 RepID=A0A7W7WJW7_9ACTN|nr:MFS transporter [Kitasatospora gansuensis]MBB4949603.1 EmrB/QacA subfamily drug resistance transporter [Kitasatospora gansuensis]